MREDTVSYVETAQLTTARWIAYVNHIIKGNVVKVYIGALIIIHSEKPFKHFLKMS